MSTQMGGSFDRVTVAPIVIIDNSARSSAAIAARKDLKRVLSDFDANHAQCYHESDRDRCAAEKKCEGRKRRPL
eukprot:1569700-Pleurochrysis_carterae.AAC.1